MPIIKQWLLDNLSGLLTINEATKAQQSDDIDLVLVTKKRKINAEVKIRYKDYNDLLIETVSSITRKTKGWIYRSKADLLIYAVIKRNKVISCKILNLPSLQEWWDEEGAWCNYPTKTAKTMGYGFKYETENKAVPWTAVPASCILGEF